MDIDQLVQPHLFHLKPYTSARDEFHGTAEVYLDANENAYGNELHLQEWHRYPDPYQTSLKQKIAAIKQVDAAQIFLGNGSDENIDLLIRLFCQAQKDHIIICPPTYGMYEVAASIQKVAIIKIPLSIDFQLDLEALQAAACSSSKILFVCSPNNPTGNIISADSIHQVLKFFPGIVAIDEAYIDYAENSQSWVSLLSAYPNLVVIQTLSKAWGLAALRIGMLFGNKNIIAWLNKIKSPYNISLLTQQKAEKALLKAAKMKEYVAQINEQKRKLKQDLKHIRCIQKVYPSDTNFLLIKVSNANHLYQFLLSKKIVVRNRSTQLGCENCLRITVGTASENKRLINALTEFDANI